MFREWTIAGADTETVRGRPYVFQLYSRAHPKGSGVWRVSERTVTDRFLEILLTYPTRTAIYAHNLEFDLPVLMFTIREPFFSQSAFVLDAEFQGAKIHAEFLFGKVNYAEVKMRGKEYRIFDTFAFFKSSLEELAQRFGLPPKLPKPRKLGEIYYQGEEWQSFKRYALRDAEIAEALGHHIQEFHRLYDVRLSLSAPQLSARIFRHRFIPQGSCIPACPKEWDSAAVLSYHGGKNGLYVPPGIYPGVRLYDINSAYPFAFTRLPNFLECEYVSSKHGRNPAGIYCVSGDSEGDDYGILRHHDFSEIKGSFSGTWITGYELQLANRTLSQRLHILEGVYIDQWRRASHNPLGDFARYFYAKKSEERGPLREFYKIVLNSLYGKFIQTTGNRQVPVLGLADGKIVEGVPEQFTAGGLWNPMIASLITGYVRAYLGELEIRYNALHSSTDSIMTRSLCPTGTEMGQLSLKAEGTALLLRPKLYLLWNAKNELTSFALHGYHGSLRHFVSMMRSGKRLYFHRRMRKFKESRIQGGTPLTMENFFKKINLSLVEPLAIPPLTYIDPKGKQHKL